MKSLFCKRVIVLFILLLAIGCGRESYVDVDSPPVSEESSRDHGAEAIEEALRGQQLRYSWREGGALYGTYYFVDVHYCNDGRYWLYGQSEKQTIEDNIQRGSWQNEGLWFVDRNQDGRLGVYEQPVSGEGYFVPLAVDGNGRFSSPGINIVNQGRANC